MRSGVSSTFRLWTRLRAWAENRRPHRCSSSAWAKSSWNLPGAAGLAWAGAVPGRPTGAGGRNGWMGRFSTPSVIALRSFAQMNLRHVQHRMLLELAVHQDPQVGDPVLDRYLPDDPYRIAAPLRVVDRDLPAQETAGLGEERR